jgi:DNA-binding IclR family transcriptional regulator
MDQKNLFVDHYVPHRDGVIGKVQRWIEHHPWQTCADIAQGVGEPSSRVSNALNALKHEGNAQQIKGVTWQNRSIWAGTSKAGQVSRDARLAELTPEHEENVQRRTIETFSKAVRQSRKAFDDRLRWYGLSAMHKHESFEA